mmetsp:Transcript_41984/g.76748  ORF Transcript_41984/g.76748 Transcript_41984/m.76748 type:complete len:255 (-) Transcript_41984:331-1095(-)
MFMWVFKVISHLLPPRPILADRSTTCRLQIVIGNRTRWNGTLGSHRLNTKKFRNLGTRQNSPKSIRRTSLWRLGGTINAVDSVEAAVLNLAELIRIHVGIGGDLVHLFHAQGTEVAGTAIDEGTVVGVLAGLAVIVDELEVVLSRVILADDVPVFPEFQSKHFSFRMSRPRIQLLFALLPQHHIHRLLTQRRSAIIIKHHRLMRRILIISNALQSTITSQRFTNATRRRRTSIVQHSWHAEFNIELETIRARVS